LFNYLANVTPRLFSLTQASRPKRIIRDITLHPMPLNLSTSNRMEVLVDSLAVTLQKPLASAFTKEVIVVQSRGMQRWLSMELAARFGVWANGHYPFPNAMVQELQSHEVGGADGSSSRGG